MKFLIVWALVALLASTNWAKEITENAKSEEVNTKPDIAEIKGGKCTFTCALKTLLFDEDSFGKDLLKLIFDYEDEKDIDASLEACNQSSTETEESCEKYFECVEASLEKSNITMLIDLKD